VSVSFRQSENPMHVEARVHASQYRNAGTRAFRHP
jgi:hypothetical protein